jgi:phosphohistidine phosphatase
VRYLTIIRHAKAEDPGGYSNDFQRPLSDRGYKDARNAARVVASMDPRVDLWISSPALRARTTAETIAAEMGDSGEIHFEMRAYPGEAEELIDILAKIPGDSEHIALVGHNPGLENLVSGLCTGRSPSLSVRMPTGAVAHLELEIVRWDQIRWGCGILRTLVAPKLVKKAHPFD